MTNDEKIFERLGVIETKLDMTIIQTTKTNGRVTSLENRMEGVDVQFAGDKGYKKGISVSRVALISFLTFVLGSIIVPLITAYIQSPK